MPKKTRIKPKRKKLQKEIMKQTDLKKIVDKFFLNLCECSINSEIFKGILKDLQEHLGPVSQESKQSIRQQRL